MKRQKRNIYFLLLICIFISCAEKKESKQIFDSNYLPEGVELVEHKIYEPTGENFQTSRIDPPSWWIGMNMDTVDLMVYNKNVKNCELRFSKPGITIISQRDLENPNYKIVSIQIAENAETGEYELSFDCGGNDLDALKFSLHERDSRNNRINSVNKEDIMYLIMPDRFANGDPENDSYDDMRQTGIHRDRIYFRHGGDIQGIIDRLDYLEDLGITAIWLNPVHENDMPYSSYHGYAITDHYLVDKRFGSNEKYRELSDSLEARGMKLVMDIIPNHCGTYHYFIQDIPAKDWIHQFDEFTWSIHSHPTIRDPYVATGDSERHFKGWFDRSMPDLNQLNPDLAKYLIQSYIWWVEYAGLDGFRVDTYQYVHQEFMHEMNKYILKEYPGLHIFAENWVYDRALQAQYVSGSALQEDFESYLPATADFQWAFSVIEACSEKAEHGKGVQRLHYTIASHYLYDKPESNIIFLDNHDMSRFYSVVHEKWDAFESGLNLLFTSQGIPCLYYGTEIGHKYFSHPDGQVRLDMIGGWKEDEKNLFKAEDRSEFQNKIYNTIQRLIAFKKANPLFSEGEFMHFAPKDFVYSYFYYNQNSCIQVIFNGSDESKNIELKRYEERLKNYQIGRSLHNNQLINFPSTTQLNAKQSMIISWGS